MGKLSVECESIEPARGVKPRCSTKRAISRRGRESNPRIAVLQTATLPLGYPANYERNERNARAKGVNEPRRFYTDECDW